MTKIIACLLLLFSAQGVAAQSIRVLSGEHSNFTRLAMVIPGLVDWMLQRTNTGYDLTVAPGSVRFDADRVFNLIPRTRIADLMADPAGGKLALSLGCDCHAVPLLVRRGVLVIDVFDGPAPAGLASELLPLGAGAPFVPIDVSSVTRPSRRPGASTPQVLPNILLSRWQPKTLSSEFLSELGVLDVAESPANLGQVHPMLLRELARATARGFLEPTQNLPELESRSTNPAVAGPIREMIENAHLHLTGRQGGVSVVVPTVDVCAEDSFFEFAKWTSEGDFSLQLGEKRARILGEFDRPVPEAVVALVQLYLAGGFGAEAASVVRQFLPDTPQAKLYLDIARVIDGKQIPDSELAGYVECDGRVALWAALAKGHLEPNVALDTKSVVRAFSELPLQMRRHFGPDVVRILLGRNDQATELEIQNAFERAAESVGPELSLMVARVSADAGESLKAEQSLIEATQTNSPLTPVALIELVDSVIARGSSLDAPMLATLESYTVEGRRSENGPELARVFVLALAASGQFGRAFDISEENGGSAAADLYQILARSGPDQDLLMYAADARGPGIASQSTKEEMARRLLALDLPELALLWIGQDQSPTARRLAADAHLELDRPENVVTLLQGMNDPESQRLLSAALSIQSPTGSLDTAGLTNPLDPVLLGSSLQQRSPDVVSTGVDQRLANLLDQQATQEAGNQAGPLERARLAGAASIQAREILLEVLKDPLLGD